MYVYKIHLHIVQHKTTEMKKITILFFAAAFSYGISSCVKTPSTTVTPTPTPTSPSSTPTPTVASVDGVLVSLRIDVTTVTAGIPFSLITESAVASFYSTTGGTTMVDAGSVSVNSLSLTKQSSNSYYKTATLGMTPSDLSFSSGSNWSVGGAGSIPSFTYNNSASFPSFTGSVTDSVITRSSGLTISLSGNVSNADSVILFVAAGSTSVVKVVSGSAASVTLSASELSGLPVVTNKTAFLEVIPYRVLLNTFSSKHYAFIKEYALVKSVNIQ